MLLRTHQSTDSCVMSSFYDAFLCLTYVPISIAKSENSQTFKPKLWSTPYERLSPYTIELTNSSHLEFSKLRNHDKNRWMDLEALDIVLMLPFDILRTRCHGPPDFSSLLSKLRATEVSAIL